MEELEELRESFSVYRMVIQQCKNMTPKEKLETKKQINILVERYNAKLDNIMASELNLIQARVAFWLSSAIQEEITQINRHLKGEPLK